MQEILAWRLEDVPPEQVMLVVAGMMGVGFLYCFLGYRLIKLILGLTGFLLAGSAAAVLVGFLSYGHLVGMGIALCIGGLCGAMALFFLYRTGIFCLGMLGASVAAYSVLQGREEPWILWAVAGIGLAGGLLAILIERPVMKLATAAIGAMLMTQAGLALARARGLLEIAPGETSETIAGTGAPAPYIGWGVLAVWLVATLVGAAAQFGTGSKKKDR
jgi:hypothetical protein